MHRKFKRYFANDCCCWRTSFPLRWNSCRTPSSPAGAASVSDELSRTDTAAPVRCSALLDVIGLPSYGRQHICIACQNPLAVLLPQNGQGMPGALHWRSTSGRGHHNRQLRPHECPIPECLDLLNLARAVELGDSLFGWGFAAAAKLDFPTIGGWPGLRKTTSSAIKLRTVWTSPAFVAAVHVATS